MAETGRKRTSDCADEVTLSRKGAKSGVHARKLRSSGTKVGTRVGQIGVSHLPDLEQQLEARTRELAEAREQQAATSEVLRAISSSPGDLRPVFQAMLEKAVRICDAKFGIFIRCEGENVRAVAGGRAAGEASPISCSARTLSPAPRPRARLAFKETNTESRCGN